MDIRQMRYFAAVAQELNFRRAAERLNLSQPPLSMQIKALEEEIGTPLFIRSQRKVELTRAGQALLGHVRQTIKQFDQTTEYARQIARGEAGRLRIGFTASVPMHDAFPRILKTFRQSYPKITVEVMHVQTSEQIRMIGDRDLDLGFLRPPYPSAPLRGIQLVPMWQDQLAVFLCSDHPLAGMHQGIPIALLQSEGFVTFTRQAGCGLFEHVAALCGKAGFVPNVVQQSRDGSAILGFVAAGVGVSILPAVYAKAGIAHVDHRVLQSESAMSEVSLAYDAAEGSPLVQRFLEIAVAISHDAGGLAAAA